MRVGFQRHVRGHRFDVRRGDGCGVGTATMTGTYAGQSGSASVTGG